MNDDNEPEIIEAQIDYLWVDADGRLHMQLKLAENPE